MSWWNVLMSDVRSSCSHEFADLCERRMASHLRQLSTEWQLGGFYFWRREEILLALVQFSLFFNVLLWLRRSWLSKYELQIIISTKPPGVEHLELGRSFSTWIEFHKCSRWSANLALTFYRETTMNKLDLCQIFSVFVSSEEKSAVDGRDLISLACWMSSHWFCLFKIPLPW